MLKVGLPGAKEGLQARDVTIAELLKAQGYKTGQFGKNHLGDRDDHLPTAHGFDEFFGSLYHLNAEEEPEHPDYFKDPEMRKRYATRGVIHSRARAGGKQEIELTGPLTKKRMETVDEEFTREAIRFMEESQKEGKPFFLWWNSTRMHMDASQAESRERPASDLPTHGGHDARSGAAAPSSTSGLDRTHRHVFDRQRRREFTWPAAASRRPGEKNPLGGRLPRALRDLWPA